MPDERLTREEALRAMTSWAAYANFDDDRKGSLEPGKFADFVVTDEDIMRIPDADIPEVKVYATYIRGQQVYARENVS